MGEMILQEDDSVEAIKVEAHEKEGEKCEFENSLVGLYLFPICFISISMMSPLKNSKHNFVWKEAVVR